MKKWWLLVLLIAFRVGLAQRDSSDFELKPVEVTTILDLDIPLISVSTGAAPILNVVYGLNAMPGVSAQDGAANTAKFAYRGFGARSQYTTSRTLFYLDDIPITGLQGFSTFEDLNPILIGSMELHQSGSNLYPSAVGGTIKLETLSEQLGYKESNFIKHQFTTGSFGLLGNNLQYINQKEAITVGYENLQREGWRENSDLNRQSLFFNAKNLFGERLQVLLYGIKNRSEIPSSLSLNDFEKNPEQAAESWGRTQGFEAYEKMIAGVTWSNLADETSALSLKKYTYSVTAFYQYRNGFEPRPFNILEDESHHGGFRGYFQQRINGRLKGKLGVFAEYHIGAEEANTYVNLYDSIANTYNTKGGRLNSTSLKSQLLNSGISWVGSFSADSTFYNWNYELALNSYYQYNSFDNSGAQEYESPLVFAPRAAISYQAKGSLPKVDFVIYKSYSISSLEENLDPNGELNMGLKPEKAWTSEIGLGGRHTHSNYRLNLYYTEVENLIVPRIIGVDQVVATNSGSSRHTGAELQYSVTHFISRKKGMKDAGPTRAGYTLTTSGYYGYFAYKSFSDITGNFSGNRLPGFPEWQGTVNGEIFWEYYNSGKLKNVATHRITFGIQAQATGGYYINDQNSIRNQPFFLFQSWLGYQRVLAKHWWLEVRAGLKNITDAHYAGMTVVNNRAFGNADPRYYYPGEPRNWFGSFSLSYRF